MRKADGQRKENGPGKIVTQQSPKKSVLTHHLGLHFLADVDVTLHDLRSRLVDSGVLLGPSKCGVPVAQVLRLVMQECIPNSFLIPGLNRLTARSRRTRQASLPPW